MASVAQKDSRFSGIKLDSDQRKNIINDILNWKRELERNNRQFGREDLEEFKETVDIPEDSELCELWMSTVGEWVASRQDCTPPATVDFDEYIRYQLGLVIRGRLDRVDYGYLNPIGHKAL